MQLREWDAPENITRLELRPEKLIFCQGVGLEYEAEFFEFFELNLN